MEKNEKGKTTAEEIQKGLQTQIEKFQKIQEMKKSMRNKHYDSNEQKGGNPIENNQSKNNESYFNMF